MTTSCARTLAGIRSSMSDPQEWSCCLRLAVLSGLCTLFASLFLLSFPATARAEVYTVSGSPRMYCGGSAPNTWGTAPVWRYLYRAGLADNIAWNDYEMGPFLTCPIDGPTLTNHDVRINFGYCNATAIAPANSTLYVYRPSYFTRIASFSGTGTGWNIANSDVTTSNPSVFVQLEYDGEWHQLTADDSGPYEGTFRLGVPIYGISISQTYHFSEGAPPTGFHQMWAGYLVEPKFYIITDDQTDLSGVIGAIGNQTNQIESSMQEQTSALLDTSGSSTILSGLTGGGSDSLLDRFGFLGQVVGWVGDLFTAFQTTSENSTLSFPGVSVDLWGHQFAIPQFSVSIWSNFPALEVPCRMFTTIVAVLLWVKGMYAAWENFLTTGKWGLPSVHVEDDAE